MEVTKRQIFRTGKCRGTDACTVANIEYNIERDIKKCQLLPRFHSTTVKL